MLKIVILAFIGGIIGWVTNILAIKLIFRPLKPINILGFELVGLIPKRREEIAKSIGDVVETELISLDDILEKVMTEEDKKYIVDVINEKVNHIIDEKMPPFVPTPFKAMITEYVDKVVKEEIENSVDDISKDFVKKIGSRIHIKNMVEDKINSFDLEKLETIILSIAKRELKHIEIIGFILGFMIGVIQGIIVTCF